MAHACGAGSTFYNASKAKSPLVQGPRMNRLHTTAAALIAVALATPGCSRNRTLPTQLAPSQVTTLAINSYLWRAAIDTVSFAPLLQANPSSGVIITDWYRDPKV